MRSLTRSMGAAAVLETAAETPPTVNCLSVRFVHLRRGLAMHIAAIMREPIQHRRDLLRKSAMKGCEKSSLAVRFHMCHRDAEKFSQPDTGREIPPNRGRSPAKHHCTASQGHLGDSIDDACKYLAGSIRNLARHIPGNGGEDGQKDETKGRQDQLTGMPRTF